MISLSSDVVVRLDAKQRAKEMTNIHVKVKEAIEKNNSKVVIRKNWGRKEVIFNPNDWVQMHFQKERFHKYEKES